MKEFIVTSGNLDSIRISKIFVKAASGANIEQCILHAIVLAAKENKIVDLEHNKRMFTIDPQKMFDAVDGIKQYYDTFKDK